MPEPREWLPPPREVVELARWMHAQYEQAAAAAGWPTQESTRVPFDALPDANRATMLVMAKLLLQRFRAGLSPIARTEIERVRDDMVRHSNLWGVHPYKQGWIAALDSVLGAESTKETKE